MALADYARISFLLSYLNATATYLTGWVGSAVVSRHDENVINTPIC